MEFPQNTIEDIIKSERQMMIKAPERFGEYFVHAMEANALLNHFLASVDVDGHLFVVFLSQIRKHAMLGILSTVRLHKVQAMMDMRQVLEAGSCAAFAIANPDIAGFADFDENGIIDPTQDLTKKRYKWLDDHFPAGSEAIKNMKKTINSSTAHSNIVYAMQNFSADLEKDKFNTPFFDKADDYHVKGDLWMIANIAYGLMDLFFGVNSGKDVLKFQLDFPVQLKALRVKNDELKSAMMATERFKAAQQLSAGVPSTRNE